MALDDGTGRPVIPEGLGMVPIVGPALSALSAVKLVTELESMTTFKREIDKLLVELEGSEAAPDKVGAGRIEPGQLGSAAFGESAYLYSVYASVHDQVEKLSKILALQVDGLSIAVSASQVGYENIDQGVRDRMLQLAQELRPEGTQGSARPTADGGTGPGTGEFDT
ncbi:hypothetical protein ABZ705_05835 [Streptomyces sp. NPDC006984]|uniref:hypothetical protein n=1 Tax=Streptomyces sp. NPDC006984 TaxID=3155463 RepID=UPI0033EB739B